MRIQISKLTLFIGVFIIISASFARQLMNFTQAYIGKTGFKILTESVLIISGIIILFSMLKNIISVVKKLIIVTLLIIGLTLIFYFIKIPEEKIHILEYGILGWFAAKDLLIVKKRGKGAILALIFCSMVGIFDELFQAILPYRYFQWGDIAYNSIGGAWGVTLYLLN